MLLCYLCDWDWCNFWNINIAFVLSILWTWIVFRWFFKPNLEIKNPSILINEKGKELIRIVVVNNSLQSILSSGNIVNIKIEACIIDLSERKYTYHLQFFENEFVLLPPKNKNKDAFYRVFEAYRFSNYAIFKEHNLKNEPISLKLKKDNYILRVRVHASSENSGFGKAIEKVFKWKDDGSFDKYEII